MCRKTAGPDWTTAIVDGGLDVTFRAVPRHGDVNSSSRFVFYVVDSAGKEYLNTPCTLDITFLKVKGYQLTIAPAEVAVLAGGDPVPVDLKNSVRFEKVYENGRRKAVEAKTTFSWQDKPDWMTFDPSGRVTVSPGAGIGKGKYSCNYSVVADYNGHTETGTGTLTVNVVDKGAPIITTLTLPDAEAGKAYSAQMTAEGLSPITWTYSGTLPKDLKLDKKTGKLSGVPIEAGTFEFTVEAKNEISSASRTFQLKVAEPAPSKWTCYHPTGVAGIALPSGKWQVDFRVQRGTNAEYANEYANLSDKTRLPRLDSVLVNNRPEAGNGSIVFILRRPNMVNNKYQEHTYDFKVEAKNNAGRSTFTKSLKVTETGNIVSKAAVSTAGDTDGGSDGVETFEPYKDGEAPDHSNEPGSTVTYFHNGSVDEDGSITAVIGTPVEGDDEGKAYVFDSLSAMLGASNVSLDKVVSVEFREGAKVEVEGLQKLKEQQEPPRFDDNQPVKIRRTQGA